MKYRVIFPFTALLFIVQIVSAQYYDTGEDPASVKWKQIKTGRFTVIYPENYGLNGIEYAKSLDKAYSKLISIFPVKKFRIPVVIHNYTVQSNGYVAWAPKRIELYPTPEQNTLPQTPEEQLTVHELTHVLQMVSLNTGFSRGMSVLLGEQSAGIVSSLLPSWFLEGDAVFAETALTRSGRGRDPSFQKQLKALILDNRRPYSFDKILNGSYRDFVPDDYETGYQMVTWALARYDRQIWNKVLRFTGDEPFTVNPVNISLSRNTGLKKKTLWEETRDTLKTIWKNDISKSKPLEYKAINPDNHGRYINYYSPVYAGDKKIIAVKTSLSEPPSFVLINTADKTEQWLQTPGRIYPWFISYAKDRLVWVETQPDPRWANREYSIIKIMDLNSRKVSRLTGRSRYLAAAISPDGVRIAGLENTTGNKNNLVLLDAESGNIIQSVSSPGNVYLQHPQWSGDDRTITLIYLDEAGEGIMSYNTGTGKWETLVKASRNNIQSSFMRNDSLYYISSTSGTDNIYLLTPGKQTFAVTRSLFGTTDAVSGVNNICFSNYTSSGNEISSIAVNASPAIPIPDHVSSSFLINRVNIATRQDSLSESNQYTPEPYRKWQHLFRFHSWMPFYADIARLNVNRTNIRPGVAILTQNTLSTLISTLGYEYSAEKRNVIHTRVTWKGWYPVFDTQLDYGTIPEISKMGQSVANPVNIQPGISFLNTISLPLQFSTGKFSQFVRPSFSANYLNQYIYIREKGVYDYGQTIFTGRLYISNYHQSAIRDIYPRWAQVMDLNYCFAPFDRAIYGSALSLRTAFYFPGFLPNNGIKIRLEAEKQDPEKYLYGNFSSLPRGYSNIVAKEIRFFSVDYVLPVAYPDLNIGSLLYIKRLRAGLFYDNASGPGSSFFQGSDNGLVPLYNTSTIITFQSYGIELLSDFHIFRIPYMISAGVRSSWKDLNKQPSVQAIFSIDLYGLTIGKRKRL